MKNESKDFLKIGDILQESKCPTCKKNLEEHQTTQLVKCAIDELLKNKTKKVLLEQQSQIQCSSETSNQGGSY